MENALKGLLLAAGLSITCMIVAFGFMTAREAKSLGQAAVEQLTEMTKDLSEQGFDKYDGIELSGSEVINALKRYQSEIPVLVQTQGGQVLYQGNFSAADNLPESQFYIRPSAVYTGKTERNQQGEISRLVFVLAKMSRLSR